MDETFEITLTTPELVLIGVLLELPDLPIEEEPPESTPEHYWRTAQASLEAKDYIRLPSGEDEAMTLDQTVATMVGALGYPQHSLEIRTFREKQVEPERAQLFGLGELIVEQTQARPDTHTLTACRTRDVALARVVDFLGLAQQPAAHTESFRIAAADMAELPYLIAGNGPEDGAVFLREAGAPARAADRLAAAFDNPVRESVVRAAVWIDGEPREVGRLTLLEEIYGLWLIAPAEEGGDTLVVAPVTAVAAIDRIRDLVFQILPLGPA